MTDLRRIAGAVLVTLLCGVSVARAEVAGVGGAGGGKWGLVILGSLVDDPEPVGIIWRSYNYSELGWSVLNPGGEANADGNPSVLLLSSGTPFVVWSRNSPQGYDVVASRLLEDGVWTEPVVLATGPQDALDPRVFLDPADGTVHLVYWVQDATPRVMHRQAPADLSSWSAAEQVSGSGEPAFRPSGVVHDGAVRIAYELHDFGIGTTPRQIVLATRVAGGGFEREMLSITLNQAPNWPEVHSANGYLWVDWIDAVDGMAWIRLLPSGSWSPVGSESFADKTERDYHVRSTIRSLALH